MISKSSGDFKAKAHDDALTVIVTSGKEQKEVTLVGSKGKKTVERKLISVKTFWINSKQLAQETTYNVKEYVMNPIKQVNYDAAGKLIQTLNEGDFETYGKNFFSGF